LRDRILGRVASVDIAHPDTQDPLFVAGTLLTRMRSTASNSLGIDEVKVRTPLSCDTRYASAPGATAGSGSRSLVNVARRSA